MLGENIKDYLPLVGNDNFTVEFYSGKEWFPAIVCGINLVDSSLYITHSEDKFYAKWFPLFINIGKNKIFKIRILCLK